MEECRCKACGNQLKLSDVFCPNCGFEHYIYPDPIPEGVVIYESDRLDNWKRQRKKVEEKIESLNKQVRELSTQIETLKFQNEQSLGLLAEEKVAHKDTKEKLAEALKEIGRLKAASQKPTATSQPQGSANKGEIRGELAFMCKGIVKKLNVYSGENLFSSPQDIELPIQGNLFKIMEREGGYVLFDLCGKTKKANGRLVRLRGDNIFDGDIFSVFDVDIDFNVKV